MEALLTEREVTFETRKMMGGLCFMVDDKMCIGIEKQQLMLRVGLDAYEDCLKRRHCRPMDFTGRPLKGYVYVDPEGVKTKRQLEPWIQHALDFNPFAKASKKKQKK